MFSEENTGEDLKKVVKDSENLGDVLKNFTDSARDDLKSVTNTARETLKSVVVHHGNSN